MQLSITQHKARFNQLPIRSEILEGLDRLGFSSMTNIQESSLPEILNGKDMLAQAKTGSGKTCCFAIGLLQNLRVEKRWVQGLVLCPTRELAEQVGQEIRRIASALNNIKVLTVYGGVPVGPQIRSLEHGAHIVVGTPGRVGDLLRKGALQVQFTNIAVLDEADRMLEMGFAEDIFEILECLPKKRQNLLFSATFPKSIGSMADRILNNPTRIKVESVHNFKKIEQKFAMIDERDKFAALRQILLTEDFESALVFCNTKVQCEEVQLKLVECGFQAVLLHGGMEQRDRDAALITFSNGSFNVMVTTDVAARGLDIKDLSLVVNYHMTRDPEIYVHRVGRTGRHDAKGISWTLYRDKEAYKIQAVEDLIGEKCLPRQIPHIVSGARPPRAKFQTLELAIGKRSKVRPGDILGALTGTGELQGNNIGKILVLPFVSYVAVRTHDAKLAKAILEQSKVKNIRTRVRVVQI